jgi:hypothetical protein
LLLLIPAPLLMSTVTSVLPVWAMTPFGSGFGGLVSQVTVWPVVGA